MKLTKTEMDYGIWRVTARNVENGEKISLDHYAEGKDQSFLKFCDRFIQQADGIEDAIGKLSENDDMFIVHRGDKTVILEIVENRKVQDLEGTIIFRSLHLVKKEEESK